MVSLFFPLCIPMLKPRLLVHIYKAETKEYSQSEGVRRASVPGWAVTEACRCPSNCDLTGTNNHVAFSAIPMTDGLLMRMLSRGFTQYSEHGGKN